MLFLHGGPGSPEAAFMKYFNRDIEKDFVMVYWEQRGAGKSYSKDIPVESMNMAQFISDTRELSEYLSERFQQDRIFIMGHSWGSLLGIMTAYKHPELFRAYFGIGQVAHQFRGEQISFEWAKEQAHKHNNKKSAEKLAD
jgi:pimeloyl-ACP methyl ester carboxylesterase